MKCLARMRVVGTSSDFREETNPFCVLEVSGFRSDFQEETNSFCVFRESFPTSTVVFLIAAISIPIPLV